jgi:hypothetical protein
MARIVPLIALAAGAFLLLKRDRTEGLWGEGLKPGIHEVKVNETLVLKPIIAPEKATSITVAKAGDEGLADAPASDYMAVARAGAHHRPEITFLKEGAYEVMVHYDELDSVEYAFNVSE